MDEIETIPQDKIIYIDETGCEQHYYREFAWTKRGGTIFQDVYGRHFARTNIIGAKRGKEVFAIKQYNEPTRSRLFEAWFEDDLMPHLSEEDVIVMDNAKFHRKKQLNEIAARHKVRIVFLPPYSPDLNPIEKIWANLKRCLKSTASKSARLQDCINNYFQTI